MRILRIHLMIYLAECDFSGIAIVWHFQKFRQKEQEWEKET